MAFTLRKALGLENFPFFYFCSPSLGLLVLAFTMWVCSSWLEWSLPLVEASGCVSRSGSCLLRPVDPPRFKSLGCRATWSPWLWVSRAIVSVTFRLRAATTAVPFFFFFFLFMNGNTEWAKCALSRICIP